MTESVGSLFTVMTWTFSVYLLHKSVTFHVLVTVTEPSAFSTTTSLRVTFRSAASVQLSDKTVGIPVREATVSFAIVAVLVLHTAMSAGAVKSGPDWSLPLTVTYSTKLLPQASEIV